ncbi:unnamed protein product, partial [Leptidea sinapis]
LPQYSFCDPWIGILRVNIDEKIEYATGLVLIKENRALALANDVAKIKNAQLERVIYDATEVNHTECTNFYIEQELNFDFLWPSKAICVLANVPYKCVFDPGMALLTIIQDSWILVGISILGPGCAMPSRFVNISPFLPWIKQEIKSKEKHSRRQNEVTVNEAIEVEDPSIVNEDIDREDDFIVERIGKKEERTQKNKASIISPMITLRKLLKREKH